MNCIKSLCIIFVLNCFKYFLIYVLQQNVPKKQTRKIDKIYKDLSYIYLHVPKYHNTFMLYTTDAYYILQTHFLASRYPTTLIDAMLQALILHLTLFMCFTFFKFTMSSQQSDMNNDFRVIFIIISIIKVNIFNI